MGVAQDSSEAVEACRQESLVLKASETKAQDSVSCLRACLRYVQAQEVTESKLSCMTQNEADKLLEAKTRQQVVLQLELEEEAAKNAAVEEQIRKYEENTKQKARESLELSELVHRLEF